MEPDGSLRRYVNVFVEQDDGRWPGEADTQLESGKQVWIVPNIAGGAAPGGAAPGGATLRGATPGGPTLGGATPGSATPEGLPLKLGELAHFSRLLDLPVRKPSHSEQIDVDIFLLRGLHKLVDL